MCKVSKYDLSGELIHKCEPFEDPLNARPHKARQYKLNPAYISYSPPTTVPLQGLPVYVNYGSYDDYDYLNKLRVHIKGHIALVRYGNAFRGDIVRRAQEVGAVAVILFTDPYDFTDGNADNTYPKSAFLPEHGIQRGTILVDTGDPQTPFYPSIGITHSTSLPSNNCQ